MFSMARTCEEFETQLNDGSWNDSGGGGCSEPAGQSLIRFAGLSAAVCISTVMMQRKVAHRMDAWQMDGEPSSGPLQPHHISLNSFDESDTESIRKMPFSHCIDNVNTSYAGSVSESVRSLAGQCSIHRPTSFKHSPKLSILKTTGTDPVEEMKKEKPKKSNMVDRGCSPFPSECFDSDIDSEARFGMACDLWHFRPTILPGTESDLFAEPRLYAKSGQKALLQHFEDIRHYPLEKDPFKYNNDAPVSNGDTQHVDTTWNLVKRIIWGESQTIAKISSPKKEIS